MVSARVAAEAVNELTLKPDQSERADQRQVQTVKAYLKAGLGEWQVAVVDAFARLFFSTSGAIG